MECRSIIRTLAVLLVSCMALTVTGAGCSRADEESTPKTPKPAPAKPKSKPVAKYDTPTEVFNAMWAARTAGQFDKQVACYSPICLENEAVTIIFQVNRDASGDGTPADKINQLNEFIKAHGFNDITDLKTPKDADNRLFVRGLLGQVKDKAAFVAGHMKLQAAQRPLKGKPPAPAPTLKDVKVTARGTVDHGQNFTGQTYFEFIDGSRQCSLKPR
jgi:hypothetical protein